MRNLIIFIILFLYIGCKQSSDNRKNISLNGEWTIAKTDSFGIIPTKFESKVVVPGLVDLANPILDTDKKYNNGVYWYKTNFTIDEKYPELIQLKIGKAKYNTQVYLNRKFVGDHAYCFTQAKFDILPFLNSPGKENELLIGVGTVNNIPDTIIWGHDFEKLSYIPGIYDEVSITMSNFPFIQNIQIVPMLNEGKVRVIADIDNNGKESSSSLFYEIKELKSGKVVSQGKSAHSDFIIPLSDYKPWTPESPFLYELHLSTISDSKKTRFGMRSFSFDEKNGYALLNGKPYYMRGTNVCILRFFEDPDRGTLPWEDVWPIKLHEQFKSMHWNSIRYCIGLPPERWYEIADSLGFLIQNEYPIWTGLKGGFERIYPNVTSDHLAQEYKAWLSEQWNHPSIVIWDAQNESVTNITNYAIKKIRESDLSNRPWENGWSAPVSNNDPIEAHPYLFIKYVNNSEPSENGALADFFQESPLMPDNSVNEHMPQENGERYSNPIINNEYGWLWLNRDGSTTTLTDRVYDVTFGKNLKTNERIYLYCRHLGMLTEYWRSLRNSAGVLHFCGLGYSRPFEPRGQTSDNFINIKDLIFEPKFVQYVKPSFAPIGLMINLWDKNVKPGIKKNIEIYAINDFDYAWQGNLTMYILAKEKSVLNLEKAIEIPATGKEIVNFEIETPLERGKYTLVAEINLNDEIIRSIREFEIK